MRMSSSGGEKKEERWKGRIPYKVPLIEINEYLMCQLCFGYLIDATAIIECQHTFCKSCILKYLETNSYCPICEVQLNEAKPLLSLRSDEILQKLVYKLVPGLMTTELGRRKDFGVKFSYENETGGNNLLEGANFNFLSRDDMVSLSLEYVKSEEGDTICNKIKRDEKPTGTKSGKKSLDLITPILPPESKTQKDKIGSSTTTSTTKDDKANDRRYLQCPAAVSVGLLKKFIRMKYGLSDDYRVDVLYNGVAENNLENELTLLDLSFIFKWTNAEPMCFHYRIFDRPTRSLSLRPGVKRSVSSVLDEPPPDDAPPSTGPTSSSGSTTGCTKHSRIGGGTATTPNGGEGPSPQPTTSTPGKDNSKTQMITLTTSTLHQVASTRTSTSTSQGEETEGSSSPFSPRDESLSPLGTKQGTKGSPASSDQVTTTATTPSSPESPSNPIKISIKQPDGTKQPHRHRHHHKEKHKRRKSKSKSKSKDKDRSKEKEERYKYNAHPNPSQSQTISVKPKHHHHHHRKHRDKDGNGKGIITQAVPNVTTTGSNTKPQTRASTPNVLTTSGIMSQGVTSTRSLERRASSSGIELKSIPISSTRSTTASSQPTTVTTKLCGKATAIVQNVKIPDSLQLQVPKSVTLIPVNPGSRDLRQGTGRGSSGVTSLLIGENKPQRPNNSHTFTHPITNKSLHQITVTEVPPPIPNSKESQAGPNSSNNGNNNVITIEKCGPAMSSSSSHSTITSSTSCVPKQFFNGPGSMEITKIYCDPPISSTVTSKSSSKPFEGKKLRGLDISITPTLPKSQRNDESGSQYGSTKLNLAGIPKIPGVSILPQALHNANTSKEQQGPRKFGSGMSFTTVGGPKLTTTTETNGQSKMTSTGNRLLSLTQQKVETIRSSSPGETLNGRQSCRTPPRKVSADSVIGSYGGENGSSRGDSSPSTTVQRKLSLPISVTGFNESVRASRSREAIASPSKKAVKRPFEVPVNSIPTSNVKKSRPDPVPAPIEKKREQAEAFPLDLSGRSTRLTPPGDINIPTTRSTTPNNVHHRPPTPIPSNLPTINPSQASPKSTGHNKTSSTPSINSIVENLTQKHQRGNQHQRTSTSSNSSKESLSPPASSLPAPIIPPVPSPPSSLSSLPYHPHHSHHHPDLLTLSNAAASVRKMKPPIPGGGTTGTAMSNLLAAANAMVYNCTQPNPLVPPQTSPPGTASLMLPGLLQQFNHHQLSAMSQMLGSPGGGMKTLLTPSGPPNLFSSFSGVNGRMPGYGTGGSLISPPPSFYNSRPTMEIMGKTPASPVFPTTSPGTISNSSPLKIPTISTGTHTQSKLRSKSPPLGKGGKSSKVNGNSPPRVSTSPPNPKSNNTNPIINTSPSPSFSFGISKFLNKESKEKSGVDPNAKAIVTSLSSGLLGQSTTIKLGKGNTCSPPKEQSLPVSKLLGMSSPTKKSENGPTETKYGSRLGDLGLALGLIPCERTDKNISLDVKEISTTSPTKMFAIPSLLTSTSTTITQSQNQAVRHIPNPSLLSSRQNCCNNNNSGVTPNKGDTRNGSVTNKSITTDPPTIPPCPKQPQSIELNMKLWIDRYESLRVKGGKESVESKDRTPLGTDEEKKEPVKKLESVTFSASVPFPSVSEDTNVESNIRNPSESSVDLINRDELKEKKEEGKSNLFSSSFSQPVVPVLISASKLPQDEFKVLVSSPAKKSPTVRDEKISENEKTSFLCNNDVKFPSSGRKISSYEKDLMDSKKEIQESFISNKIEKRDEVESPNDSLVEPVNGKKSEALPFMANISDNIIIDSILPPSDGLDESRGCDSPILVIDEEETKPEGENDNEIISERVDSFTPLDQIVETIGGIKEPLEGLDPKLSLQSREDNNGVELPSSSSSSSSQGPLVVEKVKEDPPTLIPSTENNNDLRVSSTQGITSSPTLLIGSFPSTISKDDPPSQSDTILSPSLLIVDDPQKKLELGKVVGLFVSVNNNNISPEVTQPPQTSSSPPISTALGGKDKRESSINQNPSTGSLSPQSQTTATNV